MSFAPGLFHVYFIGVDPNSNQSYTQKSPLYLVTFSSRSEADNYWRYLPYSYPNNMDKFRRFSPQLIKAPLPNLENGWKCIIQTLKDEYQFQQTKKPLIAPSDQRWDNRNGIMCYIRCTSSTRFGNYWRRGECDRFGCEVGDLNVIYIVQSSYAKFATQFSIVRATPLDYEPRADEDILIDEDYVNIFLFDNPDVVVKWRESGDRKVELYSGTFSGDTQEPNEKFKFSFFADGRPNDSGRYWEDGRSWEFVN